MHSVTRAGSDHASLHPLDGGRRNCRAGADSTHQRTAAVGQGDSRSPQAHTASQPYVRYKSETSPCSKPSYIEQETIYTYQDSKGMHCGGTENAYGQGDDTERCACVQCVRCARTARTLRTYGTYGVRVRVRTTRTHGAYGVRVQVHPARAYGAHNACV